MRTTVTLDDDLYRRAKVKAAHDGTTFSALVAEALEQRVSDDEQIDLIVSPGSGGLLHGLSTDDVSAILDFLDEADARP
jgi:hypothetical protein